MRFDRIPVSIGVKWIYLAMVLALGGGRVQGDGCPRNPCFYFREISEISGSDHFEAEGREHDNRMIHSQKLLDKFCSSSQYVEENTLQISWRSFSKIRDFIFEK